MNSHVPTAQLALYSSGDLGFWNRRRVRQHVGKCGECGQLVREFAEVQEQMAAEALQLPPELSGSDWQIISAEMTANIRLGLAAGECISKRSVLARRPRLAFAMAGVVAVMVAAGLQRPPAIARQQLSDSGFTTLESSGNRIAVRAAGHVLSVQAPADRDVIRTVDTSGEMRSRYVDDTDGVTIVNVYAE